MKDKASSEEIIHNLLDLENLSILVGTGLAKACGGLTMEEVSTDLVQRLKKVTIDDDIATWQQAFLQQNNSNFESFFNALLAKRKYLNSINKVDSVLNEVIKIGKIAVFEACCYIPDPAQVKPLLHFLKCITERKSGLCRANLFSLNYDLLIENACDRLGILLNDGFEGAVTRKFNPSAFDLDYYYPSGVVTSRPVRCERVLNFIKLHGSINWTLENGLVIKTKPSPENMFIYPSQDKLEDTLSNPFAEVFRRFSLSNKRYKNGILIIGYGFLDSHINSLILQALEQPHSFMVVINPKGDCWKSKFSSLEIHLDKLHFINETFESFSEKYLPKNLQQYESGSLDDIAKALVSAIKEINLLPELKLDVDK